MRNQYEIKINQPREHLVELFLDPENLSKWQPSLIGFKQMSSGDRFAFGAKSKLTHKVFWRNIEIIKTITIHNHPNKFCSTYVTDAISYSVENKFYERNEDKTIWMLNLEITSSNALLKLITIFMPELLEKKIQAFMNQFKDFAEKSSS